MNSVLKYTVIGDVVAVERHQACRLGVFGGFVRARGPFSTAVGPRPKLRLIR